MNTITFPRRGGHPSRAIHRPATAGTGASLRRVASVLSMVAGIVGFAVAVVALRFATVVGQTLLPRPLSMEIAIASAFVGILAFWYASTLDQRAATDVAAQ
jgi:hypothetical protein